MIALNLAVANQLVKFKKDVDALIEKENLFPPFLKSSGYIKECAVFISTVTVTVTNGRKKLPVVDWIANQCSCYLRQLPETETIAMFEATGVMTKKETGSP